MAAKDIFAAIGLGTPFYFAAVTYCFFFWLDRNASAQASRAISGWLEGHPNARIDTRQGVIDMFDHLYTSPLIRVRAFVRSCCVSLAVSLAVWISYFLFYRRLNLRYITSADLKTITNGWEFMIAIIFSDYISLFAVRKFLNLAGKRLLISLIGSTLIGACIVATCLTINIVLWYHFNSNFSIDLMNMLWALSYFPLVIVDSVYIGHTNPYVVAALLVHLWLPLFAIGASGVRLLYLIFRAVEWSQWFLKQSNQHPLRAIGMVAGSLVFVGMVIVTLFSPTA